MKMRMIVFSVFLIQFGAFAYEAPFITTADKAAYINDKTAVIESKGGEEMFYYPGIQGLLVNGDPAEFHLLTNDLAAVSLPSGRSRVEILLEGESIPIRQLPISQTAIASPEALVDAVAAALPGDQLVVRNGVYSNWECNLTGRGDANNPVVIRPETPGGVVFSGQTKLTVSGEYLVLREFIFDNCFDNVVVMNGGKYNRVTQCQFFFCGSLDESRGTFDHIVSVDSGADYSRIDHCYFTGSKSMSIKIRVPDDDPGAAPRGVNIAYNVFRDIYRIWVNGQENIQIGQKIFRTGITGALVEFNLFDNADADNEIISIKSQHNVVRYNVAAHCRTSGFVFRGGQGNRFEGNVVAGCGEGLRIFDDNHVIINNLFYNCTNYGLAFIAGHAEGRPSKHCLVANNTIIGSATGIGVFREPAGIEFHPRENKIMNNLVTTDRGIAINDQFFTDFHIENNLFHVTGTGSVGQAGTLPLLFDPKLEGRCAEARPSDNSPAVGAAIPLSEVFLDRWGHERPHGIAPDIGADEVSAGGLVTSSLIFPEVPDSRNWSLNSFIGSPVIAWSQENPLNGWHALDGSIRVENGSITAEDSVMGLTVDLPADFVMEFNYRPESFDSRASLLFSADKPGGQGYRLTWGGTAEDGKPEGLIRLDKGTPGQTVSIHPDLCHVRQNYIPSWPNGVRIESEQPHEDLWYRIHILRKGSRIEVRMNRAAPNIGSAHPAGETQPVMIWEDTRGLFGSACKGRLLFIEQHGVGQWKNVRIWEYDESIKAGLTSALPGSPFVMSIDFNEHDSGSLPFPQDGRKYNYNLLSSYNPAAVTETTLAFFMGSGTRYSIVDRGHKHKQCIYFNGSANLSQPNLGVYLTHLDMTAGGQNSELPVSVKWSFDILGNSDSPHFDPSTWQVLVFYNNSNPGRDIGRFDTAPVVQTFDIVNAGRGGTEGWKTVSGSYEIPKGQAGRFGMIQIRATGGDYISSGEGLFCLDNIRVDIRPVK